MKKFELIIFVLKSWVNNFYIICICILVVKLRLGLIGFSGKGNNLYGGCVGFK